MYRFLRSSVRARTLSSRLGSLLLLFQRTPLVKMLFPEARILGGAGLGEITKWTVAAVAGLGAYDTVAGATTITQLVPSPGSITVPATSGSALSFVFQCTGAPSAPGSWTVTGTLPPGLVHTDAKRSSTDSITGTPTQTGSFTITVKAWQNTTYSGGSSTKSFTINVVAGSAVAPTITTQPSSTTVNSGGTTSLTVAASGTPAPTFQWYTGASGIITSPISGATAATFTTPALTATTSYWARATNTSGAADSNAATITVVSVTAPGITTQPVSTTINSGGTTTLTVAASGTSPTFQWYLGASGVTTNPISGATSASFSPTNLTTTSSYWARASNSAGTANSAAATVTVITPPTFTTQPVSTTLNSGSTATLTAAASGTSPTFQWYLGASGITINPIAGATAATYTTPVLTATSSYWVRATNTAGVVSSNAATVTVITPPAITSQPASSTINSGGTTTLTVVSSGTSPGFQWYLGPTGVTTNPVSGATAASFTTPALSATSSYWVRSSNSAGTADSSAATVTVITAPTITNQPTSVTINSGSSTTLTASAVGTSPSFQWYLGNSGVITSPILGATSASFTTPTLTATNSYWVRASNAAGGTDSSTAIVTVVTPPSITNQPASTTVNNGTSTTLTVATSGTSPTFQWYLGNSGVITNPISGANASTFTTPVLTTDSSFWARATNAAGNADSSAATVTVRIAPAITSAPASATIGSGSTATFTIAASGTSPTYQWYLGNSGITTSPIQGATSTAFTTPALTSTSSYWVRATNAAGSADSATVTATVIAAPVITLEPGSTFVNSGGTATLSVAAAGVSPTFQWYAGDSGFTANPVQGATAASFTTPPLTWTAKYWARATNTAGTSDSNTAIVSIRVAPAISSEPSSVTVNSGSTATFTVAAAGTAPTFQWYLGTAPSTINPVVGATGTSLTTGPLTATSNFWVRATNEAGTADSGSATATVITAPAITSQPVAITINSGSTATFTVGASGTAPAFQWYAGNSGVTTTPIIGATSPSFTTPTLTSSSNYWVRASNAAGNADSNAASVTVITAPSITSQPASMTINDGTTTSLSVGTSGTAPAFQWYRGNSGITSDPVGGATSAFFTTPALTANTSYWARISNAAGAVDSNTATLTVLTPPTIISQPASISINSDATATLTADATGLPPITWQWYLGASGNTSTPVAGAVSSSFTTPPQTSAATYWVRVTDGSWHADSQAATVSISQFTLTTSAVHGTITGGGSYGATSSATLTATPDSGYAFSGWTGDASGTTNPLTLVMDANKTVGAAFTQTTTDPFAITFVGTPIAPRVGNSIELDLTRLTKAGETIKLSGKLPSGLNFNATTGRITGTLTGSPGTYSISVQIFQGRAILRTLTLPITVLGFPSSLLGNFETLLEDSNSLPAGACKISITTADQWSATLETPGAAKRSAKGTFILSQGSPVAPITAVFPSVSGAPSVTVSVSIDGSVPTVQGRYNGGTLRGFRLASGAEMPPATLTYNLVLDAGVQDGITLPAGLGWMKGTVSNLGVGTFKGLLGDGTAASTTLRVSPSGQAVIWMQPYSNKKSYLGGIISLGNLGQPISSAPKLANDVWWSKAADARTLSYPAGFASIPVTVGTSKWVPPATAAELGASLGWRNNRVAAVTLDGIDLSTAAISSEGDDRSKSIPPTLPTEFTLDDQFNLVTSAPVSNATIAWSGKAGRADGSVTGKLTIPTLLSSTLIGGAAATSGVLVQDDSWGTVTGCGLVKVPISGARGSFRTTPFILDQ